MSWIDETVAVFGRGLGLGELRFNEAGVIRLTFETRGDLYLERADDCVLVCLVRQAPPYDGSWRLRALAACHYREGHPFDVTAGAVREDVLALAARLPAQEFSPPALERAMTLLFSLQDKILAA